MRKLLALAAFVATGLGAMPALAATVVNGSFETPDVPTFQFNPNSGFTDQSGIYSNGSISGFANAPDGTQAAFLASSNGGGSSVFLGVTDLIANNIYSFSFFSAGRSAVNFAPLMIDFEGLAIGAVPELAIAVDYRPFTTASFIAPGTSGTLTFSTPFMGNTRFAGLDAVTINDLGPGPGAGAIPEPATWAMLIAGFAMVGAAMRRRRRPVTAFA